jgi:hypothetical protein
MHAARTGARARAPPKSQSICVLLVWLSLPVDNQSAQSRVKRALKIKRRSERRSEREEETNLGGACRVYLGWSSTKSDCLRGQVVGLHHICLHYKPSPTTRQREDSGVRSCIQQPGRAGPSTGGCLPRILLQHVRHLQQSNGTARSALYEAWCGVLIVIPNRAADVAAAIEFPQLRLIPIQ